MTCHAVTLPNTKITLAREIRISSAIVAVWHYWNYWNCLKFMGAHPRNSMFMQVVSSVTGPAPREGVCLLGLGFLLLSSRELSGLIGSYRELSGPKSFLPHSTLHAPR